MDKNFPYFYHLHHSSHTEDIPFWLSLAQEYGGPILELGCGTGRVLTPLAAAGFEVYGLDSNVGMLSFLKNNLPPGLGAQCHLLRADLSAFCFAKKFPLILMPCNTLSTLSRQTRQAALKCISQHLSPGGVFSASLPNPVALQELPDYGAPELEEVLVDPGDESVTQVSSEWKRTAGRFEVLWHYDLRSLEGGEEHLTVTVSHDLALQEDYLREFQLAGLRVSASYGSYRKTRYHASAPDLIMVACKEASHVK